MRILVVGGGSGGHVTPVAAVCKELRQLRPDVEISMWCDKAFKEQSVITMKEVDPSIIVSVISSGKLRRYHGMPFWRQLMQIRTIVVPNLIDTYKIGAGFVQSVYRLSRLKPDVVFTKGGFVCLPVGLASKALSIPLVIHDSDAHPGLTNRILAKYASAIATGAPLKYYSYPESKSRYIGIPVTNRLKPLSGKESREHKKQLGFPDHEPLVLVTGGGLGAKRLNDTIISSLDDLLSFTSVALVAGKTNLDSLPKSKQKSNRRFKTYGYIPSHDMHQLMSAADIVVTRAGATTLLELAALEKPTIIVPNDLLTGGHQTKNAKVYEQANAAVIVTEAELEDQPLRLVDALNALLLNPEQMKKLRSNICTLAKPEAARHMAQMLLDQADESTKA